MLGSSDDTAHLLAAFPGGIHFRPEGGHGAATLLLLWAYHLAPVAPRLPVPIDPEFSETVLRGMTTLAPGLAVYLDRLPKSYVDGGYYTKTQENRPLIGPLPIGGAYIFGALSGYGLMAACAGGELLAAHVTGAALPAYAAGLRARATTTLPIRPASPPGGAPASYRIQAALPKRAPSKHPWSVRRRPPIAPSVVRSRICHSSHLSNYRSPVPTT